MKKYLSFLLLIASVLTIVISFPAYNVKAFSPQDLVQASADLINLEGKSIGNVHFIQGTEGVVIRIKISDMNPGAHAMHFHNIGDCRNEDFKSAGPHIMPDGKPHGFFNPKGPHAGNLPNLIVHDDRSTEVEIYTSLISLDGKFSVPLLDDDGSAIVIHQFEDDHYTQPIGGSGERIACGVIKKML